MAKRGARVRIRNMDAVLRRVSKLLQQDLKKKVLPEIGEMAEKRIVAETRKGNSLPTESKMNPLQKHSTYIRRALSRKPVKEGGFIPGEFFRWNRSNLSQTGQLLNSIKYKANMLKTEVTVGPTGKRNPMLSGRDEFATNAELARDLEERGFRFLGMDRRGIMRIRQIILSEIRRLRIKAGL